MKKLFGTLLTFAVTLNAVNIKYLPSPDSRITVIPGSSEEFGRTLGAYTDVATASSIEPIRPYCMIVTNNSTVNVVAVVILLELEKPDGSTITQHPAFTGKDILLAPGEGALMAPISELNIRLQDIGPHPKSEGGGGSSRRQLAAGDPDYAEYLAGRVAEYEAAKQATVSIDSVAFADGSVVGPDKIQFIERSNKKREGERVVLTAAMERSPEERLAYLTEIVNGPEPPYMDYFQESRRSTARWLLQLQTGQAQAFLDFRNRAGITAEQLIINSIQHALSHQMPILFKETK